jgi:hypothetical protein
MLKRKLQLIKANPPVIGTNTKFSRHKNNQIAYHYVTLKPSDLLLAHLEVSAKVSSYPCGPSEGAN